MMTDLFVLHWNQPEACLATVNAFRAQDFALRVTVIDNDSAPDAFQRLESELDPAVEILRLEDNKGWGGAFNVLLRRWVRDEANLFCLLSAHDAMPSPNCVRLLVRAAEADSRLGIVCPQYPEPFVTRLSRWHGVFPQDLRPGAAGSVQRVDVPHGTLMLVRRECLEEIGLFDQRYFAYGDEHELGARAARRGWKVGLVWGAVVVNPATSTESAWRSYLFARNSLLLVRDHFGAVAGTLRALLILANTFRLLARRPGRDFAFSARARCRAVRDYFTGRTGRPPAL